MAYVIGKFETLAQILAMKPQGLLASFAAMKLVFSMPYYFKSIRITLLTQ